MGDFELEAVLYFMISKGGRVRNHELVTHFKNFLNHPINKAQNREKFKDYVNELATIKIDGGEKVLVLKRKYRPPSDNLGGSTTSVSSSTSSTSLSTSGSLSMLSQSGGPKSAMSEPNLTPAQKENSSSATPKKEADGEGPGDKNSPRAQSEPPAAPTSTSKGTEDNVDGPMMSKVRSEDIVDVKMRKTDRMTSSKMEASNSETGSNASLASTGSQKSATSSTSGVASMEDDGNASVISVKDKILKLNKIHSETDLNAPRQFGGNKKNIKHGGGDDDDSHYSSTSYVTLDAEQKDWMVVCSTSDYHDMNRLLSKNPNLAKLKDLTNTALHWAAKSGKDEVIKLIANKPGVGVNQRSGYTALHLAAIHGHDHIIELLVKTFNADANLRDYSGKKAKQYLKNSASSKAQQLLMSRRLGSESYIVKSMDESFLRSASMRMSNRAKAMSSLLQVKSSVAGLRSSWGGSTEDLYDEKDSKRRSPPGSTRSSPGIDRRKHSGRDMDLMPPPSNTALGRRRNQDHSNSSSRESLTSPSLSRKSDDDDRGFVRSGSDPVLLERKEKTTTIV